MADFTYKQIQPLIRAQTQEHSTLRLTFGCGEDGEGVEASATMRSDDGVASTAKTSLVRNISMAIERSLRQLFGANAVARVASDVVSSAARAGHDKVRFGRAAQEAAAVEAFARVADRFTWDAAAGSWSYATAGAQGTRDGAAVPPGAALQANADAEPKPNEAAESPAPEPPAA